MTDGEFGGHRTVKHSGGEYVRYEADGVVHSNTIENVFSVFKRGMIDVYQHCGEALLHRYLAKASGSKTLSGHPRPSKVQPGSASQTGNLVKPRTLRQKARRLWRKRKKDSTR